VHKTSNINNIYSPQVLISPKTREEDNEQKKSPVSVAKRTVQTVDSEVTELSPLNERQRHWNRRWVYHRRLAKTTTQATGQCHHSSVRRGRPTATRQTALCQTPCWSAKRPGAGRITVPKNLTTVTTKHRSSPKPR
jgi:hypothetical protein